MNDSPSPDAVRGHRNAHVSRTPTAKTPVFILAKHQHRASLPLRNTERTPVVRLYRLFFFRCCWVVTPSSPWNCEVLITV